MRPPTQEQKEIIKKYARAALGKKLNLEFTWTPEAAAMPVAEQEL